MHDYKYKFIVCEFSLSNVDQFPVGCNIPQKLWAKMRISSSFILSFIAQVQVKYGIHFLFCDDPSNTSRMVLKLFKRIWAAENG